jgi:hypothetical protein
MKMFIQTGSMSTQQALRRTYIPNGESDKRGNFTKFAEFYAQVRSPMIPQ